MFRVFKPITCRVSSISHIWQSVKALFSPPAGAQERGKLIGERGFRVQIEDTVYLQRRFYPGYLVSSFLWGMQCLSFRQRLIHPEMNEIYRMNSD